MLTNHFELLIMFELNHPPWEEDETRMLLFISQMGKLVKTTT